jgi:K+-sensing histidine kinase KdpD
MKVGAPDMVRFEVSQSPASPYPNSVWQVIQSVVDSLANSLKQQQIRLELDLEKHLQRLYCHANVGPMLRELVQYALDRSPPHAELSISACRTQRGIEIEVAECQPLPDAARPNAFARYQPQQATQRYAAQLLPPAVREGCDLYCMRCPQGGQAWTLVVDSRWAVARVA